MFSGLFNGKAKAKTKTKTKTRTKFEYSSRFINSSINNYN